jgi:uncharacterized membrane protein
VSPIVYAWLLGSMVFFAGGEYLSKLWSLRPSLLLWLAVPAAYALGTLFWLPALRAGKGLAVTGMAWTVMSVLVTVLMGVAVFGERLTPREWAGIVAAIGAMALLG